MRKYLLDFFGMPSRTRYRKNMTGTREMYILSCRCSSKCRSRNASPVMNTKERAKREQENKRFSEEFFLSCL